MCPRPGIAAVATDHGRRDAGLDRHRGDGDCEDLAGAAIVERGRELDVDPEPRADLLVVAVDVVWAAADDAVDVLHIDPGVGDGVAHRFNQEIEARYPGHPAEAAVAGPDNGAGVTQLAGWLDHVSSPSWVRFLLAAGSPEEVLDDLC